MRYSKFIINNYRAIKELSIPMSNSLIPIIGTNESGKTTILKAILAFDKFKDSYNSGEHLNYKNKYEIGDNESFISAEVYFENEEEVDSIAKSMKLKVGDDLHESLKNKFHNKKSIIIKRSLKNMDYTIEEYGHYEKLPKIILDRLPFILYFDDFSDRVPESISINIDTKSPSKKKKNLSSHAEWRLIIEEIFSRSSDYTLQDFFKMEDEGDKVSLLSDISDLLNQEIIEEWKKLKGKGRTQIITGEEDLGLKLNHSVDNEENSSVFEFKVVDKTNAKKSREFKITERSKGFQWYFNFIIKLKFNPKYQQDKHNAIYLLDEPGSYLHSSAQEELLRELKEISKQNTLMYCTHSQYLLDPEILNISSIKIAEKENGKISLIAFDHSNVTKTKGALTPLMDALHIKNPIELNQSRNTIITEGITDYYFFKMLFKYHAEFKKLDKKIILVPGAGATQLKDLISYAIAWSEKYIVFLDHDTEGIRAKKTYVSFFNNENNFLFYASEKNFLLEDFFLDEEIENLIKITGVNDLKVAIVKLFFADENKHRRFIAKLSNPKLFEFAQKIKTLIEE